MAEGLTKEFHKLMKDINRMSDGQAKLFDWDDENISSFKVEIAPNGGPYHGGKFIFQVELGDGFPENPPAVIRCETKIYHPNINLRGGGVCLNLFSADEWQNMTKPGIENVIQGFLFLFYEPNIDDPLSPLFHPPPTWEKFLRNVRLSLLGLTVAGERFPWNFENGKHVKEIVKVMSGIGLATGVPVIFKREASEMFDGSRTISFDAFQTELPRTDSVFKFCGISNKGAPKEPAPDFSGSPNEGAAKGPAPDKFNFSIGANECAAKGPAPDSVFVFGGSANEGAAKTPVPDKFNFCVGACEGAAKGPAPDSVFVFGGGANECAAKAPAPDKFIFSGNASEGAAKAAAPDSVFKFSFSQLGAGLGEALVNGAKARCLEPLPLLPGKSSFKLKRGTKRKTSCL